MLVSFEIDEANHIARLRTTLGRDAVEAVRGVAPTTGESGKP
jgi:hypothetical protein